MPLPLEYQLEHILRYGVQINFRLSVKVLVTKISFFKKLIVESRKTNERFLILLTFTHIEIY